LEVSWQVLHEGSQGKQSLPFKTKPFSVSQGGTQTPPTMVRPSVQSIQSKNEGPLHFLQSGSHGIHSLLAKTKPFSMSQGISQVLVTGLNILSSKQVTQLLAFASVQVLQVTSQGPQEPSAAVNSPSVQGTSQVLVTGLNTRSSKQVTQSLAVASVQVLQVVSQGEQEPSAAVNSPSGQGGTSQVLVIWLNTLSSKQVKQLSAVASKQVLHVSSQGGQEPSSAE
jgi:hypothetical protein